MKERFKSIKLDGVITITMDEHKGVWRADKRQIIQSIKMICEEYMRQGYTLTLRQLYYQLVSRDIIPNHDKVYKKISSLKDEAVYGGIIDWDVFEDRGRVPSVPYYEEGVAEALEKTVDYYRLERQQGQANHVEVWTEKDAISSILKRITNRYGVTLVVNKGYTSSTAIYGAYQRFAKRISNGQKVKILYFGDHDPSGLDMIRDIEDRLLMMFTKGEDEDLYEGMGDWWQDNQYSLYEVADLDERFENVVRLAYGSNDESLYELFEEGQKLLYFKQNSLFEIIQVGLTMEQIKEFNPPSNPAKMTDPRQKDYVRKFGRISWEVDALKPSVMEQIVADAIEENIEMGTYLEIMELEKSDKQKIKQIVKDINNG